VKHPHIAILGAVLLGSLLLAGCSGPSPDSNAGAGANTAVNAPPAGGPPGGQPGRGTPSKSPNPPGGG
jgi:hypothetical protein